MKQKLVFVIPRGEVIRNFAFSGILKELKEQYELHLLSVIPNTALEEYLRSQSDYFYELRPKNFSYLHRYVLGLLDLAHNRNLWSEAARVRWNMRDTEAKGVFPNFKRGINKLLARMLANNASLQFLEKIALRLASREKGVRKYRQLLEQIKPDLVFNGSHSHAQIAYPVVQAARLLHIKTAAFLFSWDNLTSQGRIIPPYDYCLAWNESIRNDFLRIYPHFSHDRVFVSGTPQFVFHFMEENRMPRKAFLESLGLQATDRYVLYSSGMSNHMPYEPEVAELLADILKEIDPTLKLVVRIYAKDRADVFEGLKQKRPDILIPEVKWEKNYQTPLIEDQKFFTNLLLHCELGVNVASTISLELCMLDKPAINIGFNPPGREIYPYDYTRFYAFDHYKPIVESGAVAVVESPEELKLEIIEQLGDPESLKEQRTKLLKMFFGESFTKGGEAQIAKMKESISKLVAH